MHDFVDDLMFRRFWLASLLAWLSVAAGLTAFACFVLLTFG